MQVDPPQLDVIYDRIGVGYDATRRADLSIVQLLSQNIGESSESIMDLGCGTGNYSIALADLGYVTTGVDPSSTMLAAATAKRADLKWIMASADSLPFESSSFETVIAVNVVHHFRRGNEFEEIRRVLKDNGNLVIFASMAEQIRRYWLAHYFPIAIERSAEEALSESRIQAIGKAAGLKVKSRIPWHQPADPVDFFLYCGKHRPELYLEPAVRAGISTFTKLADKVEIDHGLRRLQDDIDSGAVKEIIQNSISDEGDYELIVLSAKL